jgi:antitoxin HicB
MSQETRETLDPEEFLRRPYRISLTPDRDDEGNEGWIAEVDELPGCISQGETVESAVESVRDAMLGWISIALEEGRPIPPPRAEQPFSGRLLLRMPRTLHAELVRHADLEGVSLNQFIVFALSRAIGGRERERVEA